MAKKTSSFDKIYQLQFLHAPLASNGGCNYGVRQLLNYVDVAS